jgi:hypothetical protein
MLPEANEMKTDEASHAQGAGCEHPRRDSPCSLSVFGGSIVLKTLITAENYSARTAVSEMHLQQYPLFLSQFPPWGRGHTAQQIRYATADSPE